MRRNLTLLAGMIAVVALLAGPASAAPDSVRLSGPSPFRCSSPGPGTIYRNSEVEPDAAANPRNPRNLLAIWQQDRGSAGGARGLVSAASFDGGRTWTRRVVPMGVCAVGSRSTYDRVSDPAISFDRSGRGYALGLAVNTGNSHTAVQVSTTTDGGRSWSRAATLASANGNPFLDKDWVTADPTRPGTAYAVWGAHDQPSPSAPFTEPTQLSLTRDGGHTWSKTRVIVPTGMNCQVEGNQIVVDPRDGKLYDVFSRLCGANSAKHPFRIGFVTSTDAGRTWSKPHVVQQLRSGNGVSDPTTGAYIRTQDFWPTTAIDGAGRLYLAWQDVRFGGGKRDEIAFSRSTDSGASWSTPRQISTETGHQAFDATLAVNSAGQVGLTYYDFRHHTIGSLATDIWFKFSSDHGASFGPDRHLPGPFDLGQAPNADGRFLGDYEGLAASGPTFVPVFSAVNCVTGTCAANRTDIYASRVTP